MGRTQIVIDCFGGDNAQAVIRGAVRAAKRHTEIQFVLTGRESETAAVLREEGGAENVELVNACEVIENGEPPAEAILRKRDSSLTAAFRILRAREEAKAMLTAGATGAALCGAVVFLGRCEGVDRPALASMIPADDGSAVCLADCGANVDSRPQHLLEFARHAAAYVHSALGVPAPRVALLSVGKEEGKGDALVKETFTLLRQSGLNFIGNIEADGVLSGRADVVVTDGFGGNIVLKCMEGTAKSVCGRMQALLKKHAPPGTDCGFVKSAFKELMRSLDFTSQGAAVLLGVRKPLLKMHGAAGEETVLNSVEQALAMLGGGFMEFLNKGEE